MIRLPLLRSTILASLLCLVSAGTSAGGPILLDQSFAPDGMRDFFGSGQCLGDDDGLIFLCGQTFTVGLSGILTAAELYSLGAGGTLEVGLYDFSGPLTLLETSPTLVAFTSPGFYSFAFNTPVTVGDTLALLVDVSHEGDSFTFGGEQSCCGAGGSDYAGGVQLNVYHNLLGLSPSPALDFYFRTHVDIAVPEPASLLLLGVGLAGIGARRFIRRARS